ncbi:MAG: SEC-C domain-containing protein [Candidatus Diapherotrites archaeon]|nr:SEC-C domain-containing protein [Candidatus Diapherotrites archaeon]
MKPKKEHNHKEEMPCACGSGMKAKNCCMA